MKKFRGISLPELLLVVALFSLFLIIPYQIMKSGLLIGWRTESREDVGLQLRKAYFSFMEWIPLSLTKRISSTIPVFVLIEVLYPGLMH